MILLHEFECEPPAVLVNIDHIVAVTPSNADDGSPVTLIHLARPTEGKKRTLSVKERLKTVQTRIQKAREARKSAAPDLSKLEGLLTDIANDVEAIRGRGR